MSKREIDGLGVIQEVLKKRTRQKEAARMLSLSTRQVRRVVRKVIIHGEITVVHGNRGKPSPKRFPEEFKKSNAVGKKEILRFWTKFCRQETVRKQ